MHRLDRLDGVPENGGRADDLDAFLRDRFEAADCADRRLAPGSGLKRLVPVTVKEQKV